MSTFPNFYHYQEEPEVLLTHNVFGYGHPDAQRPKTPTSLINHTGHSPGPLSTPPLSRDASRGPDPLPDQPPGQMLYDDGFGSLSNSPTSVRTPDNDSFEVEMLETQSMRDFYQNQNGGMTTQASHGALPAIDTNMMFTAQGTLSDQVLQEALNSAMAAQPPHFQAQFTMQTRPLQNTAPPQQFNNYFGHNYPNQPARHDPWTGQGPPRNANVPRSSGIAVFDPVTDPVDYSAFLNTADVDLWTMNNTDPNYLVSPNEPVAPPRDAYRMPNYLVSPTEQMPASHGIPAHGFMPQQPGNRFQMSHQADNRFQNHSQVQNNSPIEMTLTTASPSPDSQNFVNYDASSSLFTKNYITDSRQRPSPVITSIERPTGTSFEWPHSPFASASSPGGSDGMFSSYQQSDSGMAMDSYPTSPYEARPGPTSSSMEVERSPSGTVPEFSFDVSPEPEPQPTRSRQSVHKGAGRPGGRALGTHLEPKVAKAAHDMRKIVACWHCVLQRDKCGPGDTCERCQKRSQRPNADCGLGCSRIKLIELAQYFLPMVIMQIHEDSHLTHFVSQFIHQWGSQEITIYVTCSQKKMPRIPVKVYEFAPRGEELLVQIQYQTDPRTKQRVAQKKRSPALGMVHINHNEEKKYDKYLNDIVDGHLDALADVFWVEDDNDFAPRLYKLITRVKPKSEDEAKLLREVNRLLVCTYIMSHTLTIAEETKIQTLSKMRSYTGPQNYAQNYTSPRMANRQMKYFFARLQRSTISAVLNKLQQIFKSSKGCDKWVVAFIAVVVMTMAHEDQQKTIHQVMQTRATTEKFDIRDAHAQADIACREIDQRMYFIHQIFRWKYNRKCNPLRDADHDWEKEVGFGDESSVTFVRSVAQLVRENYNYLQQKQGISISHTNQVEYTARLVGSFLLSFWSP